MLRLTFFSAAMPVTSLFLVTGCVAVQPLQSVAAAGNALANTMTGSGEKSALTAVELRQLQTRDLGISKAAAFGLSGDLGRPRQRLDNRRIFDHGAAQTRPNWPIQS